ncbi:DCC1-like thiol-disulfide oxidoreductase family protein [Hyphomicrobium sp. CS1GBMeth3]|uniref:DCC1-like thiol-disulfide oxidoreductase family protein n=1 Tax=Hyphomicrobium sp. CS1GBMeth3 TaxID=1892845 RepID=UPI00093130C5|nr:DCC1-like thiol-disulfide oxidoreductase family protein [Hyphomicrobium sp. CS1GBMeth3]
MLPTDKTYIVYDGQCPFCSQYVKLLRLRDTLGHVELIDARTPHAAVDYVARAGVVLDQEMALIQGGEVYSGAACINRLALMSTRSGVFNRLNALAFSSPTVSRFAYPILRTFRNLTLRLLGREPLSAS